MPNPPQFLFLVCLVTVLWEGVSACFPSERQKCVNKASSDFKACCRSKRLPLRVDDVCDYDYVYRKFMSPYDPWSASAWRKPSFELFDTPIPNQQQVVADFIECFNRGVDHTDCCLNIKHVTS